MNKYDDNFRGLYCVCKRPYPDKESPVEQKRSPLFPMKNICFQTADDAMIQCMICEDWFHSQVEKDI